MRSLVPSPPFRTIEVVIAGLLCLAFVTVGGAFMHSAAPTFDEVAHLPAGYSYLKWHDYRLNPEHPPLAKKWAALPLLTMKVWPADSRLRQQDISPSSFSSSERLLRLYWTKAFEQPALQWNVAHEFLYGVKEEAQHRCGANDPDSISPMAGLSTTDYHNQPDRLILTGRITILSLGVALALLVYFWARQLHRSIAAGTLALALFVFDPNFIANSSLITTDVPLALFLTATLYFFWRTCRQFSVTNAVLFSVCFALSFVTKFSCLALVPILLLLALFWIFNRQPWPISITRFRSLTDTASGRSALIALLFLLAAVFAWIVIWGFYDFRYAAARDSARAGQDERRIGVARENVTGAEERTPGYFAIEQTLRRVTGIKDESTTPMQIGFPENMIAFAVRHRLLPESYLYGLAAAKRMSQTRPAYLRGQYSPSGFRSYFFWTFLLKTPLPALIAVAASILLLFRRPPISHIDVAFVLIPVATYFALAVISNVNIGHRHLLPIYPFLYVLCGGLALFFAERLTDRWKRPVAIAAIVIIATASSIVFAPLGRAQILFPHYLAYFNELAGGPSNGWRSLSQSNLDWGQDLKGLKEWIDRVKPERPTYLSYFGMADPRFYQIQHRLVPSDLGNYAPIEVEAPQSLADFMSKLEPGDYIAVSVEHLVGSASPKTRQTWRQIAEHSALIDQIGYSIFIFKFTTPFEKLEVRESKFTALAD